MPQLDRTLEKPGDCQKDKLLATLIASVIVIGFIATVVALAPLASDSPVQISYVDRDPILINDSADFAVQAALPTNNWSGNGTQGNPYVIQGYRIDASANEGIAILNTNVYFSIKDCYLYLGGIGFGTFDGVYLYNCSNGTLINNTCTGNFHGIRLASSSNNTLSNNSCIGNVIYGILLSADSNDNNLFDNNCTNNGDAGIRVAESRDNSVSYNTCLGNYDGIEIIQSSNNTVGNNTVGDQEAAESCGIWLLQSDNITVIDNTCFNAFYGLALSISNNNTIRNNVCFFNDDGGIFFYSSSNNSLLENVCSNNTNNGVYFDFSCNNNTVLNNSCSGNAKNGISLYSSRNNTLSNNNCSWNEFGIYFSECNDNNVYDNICQNNSMGGIALVKSNKSNVSGNSCSGGNRGIGLGFSNYSIISDNICSNNERGISVEYPCKDDIFSNNILMDNTAGIYMTSVTDCTMANNSGSGSQTFIDAHDAHHCTIYNNTCAANNIGISLESSSNNTVHNNTCVDNWVGIVLSSSRNCILSDNVMFNDGIVIFGDSLSHWNTHNIGTSNTVNGESVYYYRNQTGITVPETVGQLILANCTDFIVENRNLDNASIGIDIGFCSNGILSNNTCDSNYICGIFLMLSNGNILKNNTCFSSSNAGIIVRNSSGNTLTNNTCTYNGAEGIYVAASNGNSMIGNNCSYNHDGICLETSSDSNEMFWNQLCYNIEYGVHIKSGSNNTIWNNTFIGNNGAGSVYNVSHVQANDTGTNNCWNTSGSPHGYGNYWSDLTGPDNVAPSGIVDWSYNLTGSAGAKDYYPLTDKPTPPYYIPEFSEMIVPIVGLMLVLLMLSRRRDK